MPREPVPGPAAPEGAALGMGPDLRGQQWLFFQLFLMWLQPQGLRGAGGSEVRGLLAKSHISSLWAEQQLCVGAHILGKQGL